MKYIFIHIGKTAGTSFRDFLSSNTTNNFFGYESLQYLVNKDEKHVFESKFSYDIFNKYELYSGHIRYGLDKYIKGDCDYITMFRDPLERTISEYRYGQDRGWYNSDFRILNWFKKNNQHFNYEHYQINHLITKEEYQEYKNGEDKIKIALERLKQDNITFGFVEEYDQFIDLCCDKYKWNPKYKKINITKTQSDIDDDEIEILKKLLKDELNFYDESLKIYNEKYKSFINND